MKYFILALALTGLCLAEENVSGYKGYQVIRTAPLTEFQASALKRLSSSFDFWKDAYPSMRAQIMVSPSQKPVLVDYLARHGVQYEVSIQNVDKLIQEQRKKSGDTKGVNSRLSFDEYHTYDEITAYLEELAATQDYINTVSIGQTEGGIDIMSIQITKAGPGAKNVFIEAGIHAREWIAPAVATYTLFELIENYDAHPDYVDNFNIYVVPVANPDGYEYTWATNGDRLWRKNRAENAGSSCIGVDLNRNFDEHWNFSGTSGTACGDAWAGSAPGSELETQALIGLYESMDPKPEVAICFHSAAELWLYPYGWALGQYQDNVDEVRELANDCVDALNAQNGENFNVLNSAQLYPASGAADDWYASQGSRFVYTPELRDNGFGFLLPPNQIFPSGTEVWAAWEVIFAKLAE